MADPRRVEGQVLFNARGGLYQPGRPFPLVRKCQIAKSYFELCNLLSPRAPTVTEVANAAEVSWTSARKVIEEIRGFGRVLDPDFVRAEQIRARLYEPRVFLPEHEIFLLSMRACYPKLSNKGYCSKLHETYGISVSPQCVSHWFRNRYSFKSKIKTATLTPLDKFMPFNWTRWAVYAMTINRLEDHFRLNWLDEKHFVNSDSYKKKVRSCPLTGRVDNIKVSGNFRDAYNCFAAVSAHPEKEQAMVYAISTNKGTARAFLEFIEYLIASKWLWHDDILVMDNASIHTGGDADIVEDLLWNFVRDGHPLNILVLYLPTRSPELNPIELCFHILAQRVRNYRDQNEMTAAHITPSAIQFAADVMDNMDSALIGRCARHCGYKT